MSGVRTGAELSIFKGVSRKMANTERVWTVEGLCYQSGTADLL